MNVIISSIDKILNFGKANSLWPLAFGSSCCGAELLQTAFSGYDSGVLNPEIFTNSPQQADLLICTGVITAKAAPELTKLYQQMPEPKYVIAMGSCAISGGMFYDSNNGIQGVDSILPVDIYLPGCPPKPEALIDALTKLKNGIKNTAPLKIKEETKTHCTKQAEVYNNVEGLNVEYFGVDKL